MAPSIVASELRELTLGLVRGDDVAWARFHRDFGPGIFRHLLAATGGDHDLAAEALQQAYLRVARHARPCSSEPEFRSWLRIITRSALSDCRRRRVSFWRLLQRRQAEPDIEDSRVAASEEDRLQHALTIALAALNADDRALLEEKYFSGHDVQALAARRSISHKAAESRLGRARALLRQHLLAALAADE